jgi:hypothetical protein
MNVAARRMGSGAHRLGEEFMPGTIPARAPEIDDLGGNAGYL